MQAIWRRIPEQEAIDRHKPKIAGFVVGIVAPIMGVMFFHAVRTGEGLYQPPDVERVVIYPNL